MNLKKAGQKNTSQHNETAMIADQRNMLINSKISNTEIMQEKSYVNKMLFVLIFLMVR